MKDHRLAVTQNGAPDVLQVVEEDLPEPGPGEARVRVLAAGISAFDVMLRRFARDGRQVPILSDRALLRRSTPHGTAKR
jgi:NADPH:quinone reductase-like Zn-dependent oxidoreductase